MAKLTVITSIEEHATQLSNRLVKLDRYIVGIEKQRRELLHRGGPTSAVDLDFIKSMALAVKDCLAALDRLDKALDYSKATLERLNRKADKDIATLENASRNQVVLTERHTFIASKLQALSDAEWQLSVIITELDKIAELINWKTASNADDFYNGVARRYFEGRAFIGETKALRMAVSKKRVLEEMVYRILK